MLRTLAGLLQIDYEQTLAIKGVLFVPLATAILLWCYRRLEVRSLRMVLLALCLSSYFWAALIESRPQQWGQMLVLLGSTSLWLALSARANWVLYGAVLSLTAFTHILSYVLLLLLSAWVVSYFFLLRGYPLAGLWRWFVASAISGLIFILPGGPYHAMVQDIGHNHIRDSGWAIASLGLLLAGLWVAMLALRHRVRDTVMPCFERGLQAARRYPLRVALVGGGLLAVTLSLQAAILPPDAWRPYDGSVLRFAVSQSGNLGFAVLALIGWFSVVTRAEASPAAGAFAVMSLGWAGIGGILLTASLFLLDTNWLLRVLNYALLFAAPLAALPLAAVLRRYPLAWSAAIAMVAISYLLAVRHLAIYSC